MDEKGKRVLNRLQAMCARREYCLADIRKKATDRLDGDKDAAEEIVSLLEKDKFVDETRYSEAFVSEKSSLGGWGPIKIRRALSAKGIPPDIIAGALSGMDHDKAGAKLEKLMGNKWRSLQGDPQAKLKLLRYALSRGYDYDEIRPVADRLICRQDEDGI